MPYTQAGLPYASGDSDTSHDAAVAALAFVGPQGQKVLDAIQHSAGLTQPEISLRCGIGRASVCARVRALEQAGKVRKIDGVRRGGCAVYVAVD